MINTITYSVIDIVPVGLGTIGVAVTPDGKKVYVVNQYSSNVSVIDTATNQITSVSVGNGPYGVAITPDGKEVYVVCKNDKYVAVINDKTEMRLPNVPVGDAPKTFEQFIGSIPAVPPQRKVELNGTDTKATPQPPNSNDTLLKGISVILVIAGLLLIVLTKVQTNIEIGLSEKNVKYVGNAGLVLIAIGVLILLRCSHLI